MVGYREIETEQADDGSDQTFGLPQRQAEHGTQGQCRCDRQSRIARLTTSRGPWFRTPGRDRLVGGRVEDWRADFGRDASRSSHVSSPRHIERNVRISRIALSHLLHVEVYGTYPAGATFGSA